MKDKSPVLVSLADVSKSTGKMLSRGAFSKLDTGASPTLAELTEALHFALGDGRIWLNDQRMVLMQSQVLGRLRQEIIDAFGMEAAKGIFMRVGYMQGVRDAELILKRFPSQDLTHALAAGPRVHTLEGFVKVETKEFEFDSDKGSYFGEFYWYDSSEAANTLPITGFPASRSAGCRRAIPAAIQHAFRPPGDFPRDRMFGHGGLPLLCRRPECGGMGRGGT